MITEQQFVFSETAEVSAAARAQRAGKQRYPPQLAVSEPLAPKQPGNTSRIVDGAPRPPASYRPHTALSFRLSVAKVTRVSSHRVNSI